MTSSLTECGKMAKRRSNLKEKSAFLKRKYLINYKIDKKNQPLLLFILTKPIQGLDVERR